MTLQHLNLSHSSQKNMLLSSPKNSCETCHAAKYCMFAALNFSEQDEFKKMVRHQTPLQRGEHAFIAGDRLESIHVVHSGSVKSYIDSSDGERQITGFHLPGDVLGLNGMHLKTHTDSVDALETSDVCQIDFAQFDHASKSKPMLRQQLLIAAYRQLSHGQKMMLMLGKVSAERRLAYFLLDLSQRAQEHDLSPDLITLSMTRQDIANYLGLVVETVSRLFTKLQRSGIIAVERRTVNILDQQRLESIAENDFHLNESLANAQRKLSL